MKFMMLGSIGLSGLLVAGQQASEILDAELAAISPDLQGAIKAVEGAVGSGFSVTQVALASIAMPLVFQVLKIAAGYAETHRDGIKDRREREAAEHRLKLEIKGEEAKADIAHRYGYTLQPPPVRVES